MPALKHNVDARTVAVLADELTRAWPGFPTRAFAEAATRGLDELELKDRIRHIASALQAALPPDAPRVVAVLDAALRSRTFDGWMVWPVAELLGRLGPDAPEVLLPAMARLTSRASCEFALRPCLEQHPALTFAHLEAWVDHPDEHVRRLVSEGTRPRLPWGSRLRALQADPTPALALLDRLRDDDSAYVRRSVANHLGDIAKDHPELALATARRWVSEGGRYVDEVVRHGLRGQIKAGEPTALRLIGYDADAGVRLAAFGIDPRRLRIGDHASLTVQLVADGDAEVPVMVEYLVHYLGARGPRKPKAYRLGERVLAPGVVVELRRRHRFDHASIRTLHAGRHVVEVQVNGRILGSATVELTG